MDNQIEKKSTGDTFVRSGAKDADDKIYIPVSFTETELILEEVNEVSLNAPVHRRFLSSLGLCLN